ncbi:unnamed protein product [Mycena citricolor]|uniref:MACPF domain-containing protein n=1 Tax=Mycena citricolor TaxID=2018698 RepID=A0AAD2HGN5_9AGAR|nr:unnamed protein product [Mycena citricolor]CAK5273737.1 unnamed protein product [Mycena citricolor]
MSDVAKLDQLLPLDPNVPSVPYQAHENTPVYVPWTRKRVVLGTGLDISQTGNSKPGEGDLRLRPSAFAGLLDPPSASITFKPADAVNSFRQSSSTASASSYEHLDMSMNLSAGGSLVGASGRGAFAKNVAMNRDSNKVSLQASLRIGHITFSSSPTLSAESRTILAASPDQFHEMYGSYFVSALSIGADTSTFLSTSSAMDIQSEMRDIQAKAKVLWVTVSYRSHYEASSAYDACDITYEGFDTLTNHHQNMHASDRGQYSELMTQATVNVAGGIRLVERVKEKLQELGLDYKADSDEGELVAEDQMKGVFENGLVVEVMFLPFAGLRDYVAITSTGSRASRQDAQLD